MIVERPNGDSQSGTYDRDRTRVASSELLEVLFGDTSRYRELLQVEKRKLLTAYADPMILDSMFDAVDSRVINICPMVLCDALLKDLSVDAPDDLLAGLGLSMFSISTHDDLVDELPTDRIAIAGLTYAGNIATLEGLKLLIRKGYTTEAQVIIDCMNRNHFYQTKIAGTLWKGPTDEEGYLNAISHTKYWVAVGLEAGIVYAQREGLRPFVSEFSDCYGTTCQLYDDVREIKDDVRNGYWSLPISYATANNLDLGNPAHLNMSAARSHEIASALVARAHALCGGSFLHLDDLVTRIHRIGSGIAY